MSAPPSFAFRIPISLITFAVIRRRGGNTSLQLCLTLILLCLSELQLNSVFMSELQFVKL